ncbi:MAG: TIGR02556 family CRISPR-associated protein [bacterium]
MFTIIKNFTELGENVSENISDHLANPASKQCKYAYFIDLEEKTSEIIYKGITNIPEEVGDEEKVVKYLYPKNRAPNGPNKTPTIIFNNNYEKKIFDWFKTNKQKNVLFEKIFECLKNNTERINEDLTRFVQPNNFLSIKINGEYIGQKKEFVDLFNDEEFIETISGLKGKPKKILENSVCCICFEEKAKLYGFSIPYNFASIQSNFSYEFDEKNAVKQIPVCFDCAKAIRVKGTTFLDKNLNFTLAGNFYFLLPELIYKTEENKEKFKQIISRLKQSRNELFSLDKKNDRDQIISKEKAILRSLKDQNYIILNLFFYKKDKQEFSILANIEEILPSNLRRFFETANKYEDLFNKTNIFIPKKDENISITFNFSILYHLLENDKTDYSKRSKKEFFETLDNILNLKKLSYQYFLDKSIKKIHENAADFLQDKLSWVKQTSFNSFLLINILADLELISIGEIQEMHTPTSGTSINKLEEFYNQFSLFFNTSSKKAIFALGVLTEKLANIQFAKRQSKPIYKKLKNFKLDQKYITERLIPELKDKFIAYETHSKDISDWFEKITYYIINDTKQLTASEASYIFVLGINMQKQLLPSKNKNNETDNKEMENDN